MHVKCNFTDDNNTNSYNYTKDKIYVGLGSYLKGSYTEHNYTFKHTNKKNSTIFSNFVWQYFDRCGTKPKIEWSIFYHANNNIRGASKIFRICNFERTEIVAEDSKQ